MSLLAPTMSKFILLIKGRTHAHGPLPSTAGNDEVHPVCRARPINEAPPTPTSKTRARTEPAEQTAITVEDKAGKVCIGSKRATGYGNSNPLIYSCHITVRTPPPEFPVNNTRFVSTLAIQSVPSQGLSDNPRRVLQSQAPCQQTMNQLSSAKLVPCRPLGSAIDRL